MPLDNVVIDPATLGAALRRHFGFDHFRPGQEEALRVLLGGAHTLVVMPTGAGKSLIYQLAAMLLPGAALVVSPLIALMKDQVDSLARRGIPATYINSAVAIPEQRRRLADLIAGKHKIVLVAPERLRSRGFRDALRTAKVSLLVVDEAHCVSEWGHDFRPDYLHIADVWRELGRPLTLALTATATVQVQQEIVRLLGLPDAQRLVTGFNRPNLLFEVFTAFNQAAKLELLREFLTDTEGPGIIYAGTRSNTEEVAVFAQEVIGIETAYYHAGLDTNTRARLQDAFMAGDLSLIVATNAFGMGIDRPDVRFVLHYGIPSTLEAYYQEAGRAGRDGLPARACLLYSPKDRSLQEWLIDSNAPSPAEIRKAHGFLVRTPQASFEEIEVATGLPQVKARIAVEALEAAGIIQRGLSSVTGAEFKVQPIHDSDLDAIGVRVKARQQYRRSLLAKMVEYAETSRCRRRVILDYFGDTGPADALLCCDNDLARAAGSATSGRSADFSPLPKRAGDVEAPSDSADYSPLPEQAALTTLQTVKVLRFALGRDKLAKFLTASKAEAVERYRRHPSFGALAGWRRRDVAAIIDDLLKAGYLKAIGGDLPIVALTPKGEAALQAGASVTLQANLAVKPPRLPSGDGATSTLDATRQLVAEGLTPEEIADRRNLAVSTIYSHVAQLIGRGVVSIDGVVPSEIQAQVRAAIEQVGSTQYLAPIKALLSEIDYNIIRCVVNADNPPHQAAVPSPATPPPAAPSVVDKDLLSALKAWRLERARTEQVAPYVVFHDATLERIAAARPVTRQELDAIRGVGPRKIERYGEDILTIVMQQHGPAPDPVAAFLARPHPRPLPGPWLAGWALDFHSHYDGDQNSRGRIGQLVFRYKYAGEVELAARLADAWAGLLAAHTDLPHPDAIIAIPPSTTRAVDPVATLAAALGERIGAPVLHDALVKTRTTRPQKEMTSLAQKRTNVAGAFALRADIRGNCVLLLDDLYDSGATLQEAARVLARGRPASIVVLTLTKTIHSDA